MTKKPSFKHLGKHNVIKKKALIEMLLIRRYNDNREMMMQLLKYIKEDQLDDLLLELLYWEEARHK